MGRGADREKEAPRRRGGRVRNKMVDFKSLVC